MSPISRRSLLNTVFAMSAARVLKAFPTAGLAAVTGCAELPPKPFEMGATIPAPIGCQELLANDSVGDC
jgi:hypothetical protein